MKMDIKNNVKNKDIWLRGLFILIFGVIFYFLYGLIWLLVIFQFVTKVITGKLNSNLEQWSTRMTCYAMQILNYITFQSEERHFLLAHSRREMLKHNNRKQNQKKRYLKK